MDRRGGGRGRAPLPMAGGAWAQAGTLKISHQFPGGTATEGDFRDRLCRRFAADIEKRSNGALKAAVYPGSSLMKTNAQFSAMRKGALDISLYPLSYAGGEVPETNIGLMPALVPSYEVGAAWKTAEVGKHARQDCSTRRASSSSAGSGRPAASPAAPRRWSSPKTPRA